MRERRFIRKMQRFYRKNTGLAKPRVTLDWVNDTGWESEIYAFTLAYGPKSDRRAEGRVLRLLTGGNYETAKSEHRTLSLLHQAEYSVPQPYHLGSPGDGFGRPFIIMERIEGGDFSARFNENPLGEPLRKFIALFHRLHSLDWRPYIPDAEAVSPPEQPYFHFDQKLAEYSQALEQGGLNVFDPAIDWLRENRGKAACNRASVVHMDFHHNNILEDENGKCYVIDWTAADISDYRFDLAWTLTLALAYRGKEAHTAVLAEYERQLGDEVPSLEIFEVIGIIRRIGTVMISVAAGADSLGMRPEAVNAMRKDRIPLERLHQRLEKLTGKSFPEIGAFLTGLRNLSVNR